MPLKSLVINGFKSFADKIQIDFNSGITGIVGPNGSGKSNITEAIRFVMGETSAKSLRGDNMKDIIFGGTQLRAPINRAEVTLYFDNHKHEVKYPADEIEITRRVFRNSDSEYLINQKAVRLRDIQELFMDSGLSKDSMSIISQGRVEQIFNAKPLERRAIIEEAAGLLHFKKQKEVAENQLVDTTENLIRITDLVNEIKNRIEPLHEQSSLAKEYQVQKKAFDTKNKALLGYKIYQENSQKTELEQLVTVNNEEIASLDESVSKTQEKLTQLREDLRVKNESLTKAQDQLTNAQTSGNEIATSIKIAAQSSDFDQTTLQELETQIANLTKSVNSQSEKIAEQETIKQEATNKLADLKTKQDQLTAQLTDSPFTLQMQLEEKRNEYINLLQEQTSLKNQIVYTNSELDKLSAQDADENAPVIDESLVNSLQELQAKNQELVEKNKQINDTITTNETTQKSLNREVEQANTLKNQISDNKHRIDAEVKTLERYLSSHEGYFYGVKNILNHQADFPGVIGTVGDLISFDEKLKDALNVAIGSNLQSLVVNSQNDAKNAIKTLKQMHFGRATFLPLDVLRTRQVDPTTKLKIQKNSGFVGVFSELIAIDSKFQGAIDFLLGNTIVATDIDAATKISQLANQKYKIVTLEGDVLNPSGVMSGGTKQKNNNQVLENKTKMQQLTKESQTVANQYQKQVLAVENLTAELDKIVAETLNLRGQLLTSEQEIRSNDFSISQLSDDVERQKRAQLIYQNRHDDLISQRSQLTSDLKNAETNQSAITEQITANQAEIAALNERISDFNQQSETLQGQVNQINQEIAVEKNNIESITSRLNEYQQQQNQLKENLQTAETKKAEITGKKAVRTTDNAQLEISLQENKNEISQLERQINELQADVAKLREEIASLETGFNNNYEARKIATVEQEKLARETAKLEEKLNQQLETLRESYGLSFEAVAQELDFSDLADKIDDLASQIKLHQMSLDEIGPVNLNAIEEYESEKVRFDFLSKQSDDLIQAKEDLISSMNDIDEKVKEKFEVTFDKISRSFNRIFPLMFGGGTAKLVLTEPDDLLSTGLEIIAQPPGKKLQQLSLLSGGERALTAITLLFAILEVNPVPFVILDEVEASLDEANVIRFAKFLQNYDTTTQFIIITHRQGTMEQADQLYGVVMEESGVSKVLSVSLQDFKEGVEN